MPDMPPPTRPDMLAMPGVEPGVAHDDALAAARARDAHLRDPVRFRLAEALARRGSAHAGAARRVIDERVAAIVHALADLPEPGATAKPVAPAAGRHALTALVAHAARHRVAMPSAVPPTPTAVPAASSRERAGQSKVTGAAADATTVQFFKRTWSRLSADQRLAQSRASLPDNAGPLNSQHLLHRALVLMRELSPEYLEHFVGYVDALQWLEQAGEAAAQEAAGTGRPAAPRRSMAARRG